MQKILFYLFIFLAVSCTRPKGIPKVPQAAHYTLIVKAENGGDVNTKGGTFQAGTQVTLTAVPHKEYVFTRWSNGAIQNPLTITLDKDTHLSATFTKRKYPLSVAITGEGTVSEDIIASGKTTTDYTSGSIIRLTANPASDWEFTGWTGTVSDTSNPIELTMDNAKKMTANFVKKKYTLAVYAIGQGTVSETVISKEKNPTQYDAGTLVRLTANPSLEWVFDSWSGSLSGTTNPIVISIDGTKNVSATFVKRKYPLTIRIVGQGTVSETLKHWGKPPSQYTSGSVVQLSAQPNPGWGFSHWSGTLSSTVNPIEITLDQAQHISANFKNLPQGAIEEGVFIYSDYDIHFRRFGNGSSKVVLADVFGAWNDDNTLWEFSDNSHGGRMVESFLHYADTIKTTLYSFDGNSDDAIRAIKTDETVIISASTHRAPGFEILPATHTSVGKLKLSNTLYLSSLENAGVDGNLEQGTYTYPHANNAYVIENDPHALDQTIFVAFYLDWGSESLSGSVDLHGGFVENNLEDIVFVEMTTHRDETEHLASTSHATPKLAAFAAQILAKNPSLSAEGLKDKILSYTVIMQIEVGDLRAEKMIEGTEYDFVQNGIGYFYEFFPMQVRILPDDAMDID